MYRETRERVLSLVSEFDTTALGALVPACPAWSVQDVVAHLTATAQDAVAGRLSGPPTEEETAAQVARFAGCDIAHILAAWTEAAPRFETAIGTFGILPALIDITSHEHDIRGAVGRPGARDSEAVRYCAERLLSGLRSPAPLRVVVEDAEFRVGPDDGAELILTTSRFEALRWRMGRRSRAQLAALDWSSDPTQVLDHLVVFGPATSDVIE